MVKVLLESVLDSCTERMSKVAAVTRIIDADIESSISFRHLPLCLVFLIADVKAAKPVFAFRPFLAFFGGSCGSRGSWRQLCQMRGT